MTHSDLTVRPSRNLADQDRIYAVVAQRGRGADAQERAAHAQLGQMFVLQNEGKKLIQKGIRPEFLWSN